MGSGSGISLCDLWSTIYSTRSSRRITHNHCKAGQNPWTQNTNNHYKAGQNLETRITSNHYKSGQKLQTQISKWGNTWKDTRRNVQIRVFSAFSRHFKLSDVYSFQGVIALCYVWTSPCSTLILAMWSNIHTKDRSISLSPFKSKLLLSLVQTRPDILNFSFCPTEICSLDTFLRF